MSKLIQWLRWARKYIFPIPVIPRSVSQDRLKQQASDFFHLPIEEIQGHYQDYLNFHQAQKYEEILGERKTLCFEEAFLIYLVVLKTHPSHFVEIGTQYGKSTRRIIDALHHAGNHSCKVLCFDIVNEVKFFTPQEALLEIHDVTADFKTHILEKVHPEIIFLDARPYYLLETVVSEFLEWTKTNSGMLAIHDCTPALFKRWMVIKKNETSKITSHTGVWERHVLQKVFRQPSNKIDDLETKDHRLKIFETPHGLALIMPKNIDQKRFP